MKIRGCKMCVTYMCERLIPNMGSYAFTGYEPNNRRIWLRPLALGVRSQVRVLPWRVVCNVPLLARCARECSPDSGSTRKRGVSHGEGQSFGDLRRWIATSNASVKMGSVRCVSLNMCERLIPNMGSYAFPLLTGQSS